MKTELTEKEKRFWKKIDRDNKIHQSNKVFITGGFLIIFFTYEYVKLCLRFPNYEEFVHAIRSTEKTRSLGFLAAIAMGIFLIWLGIKIRKSPIIDHPRELP